MTTNEGFAAFAGAKHALRALAQSMARELWPRGIHVAHPVIDGAIDTEFIRSNFPHRYALKDEGASSIPITSLRPIGRYTASRVMHGRMRPNFDRGLRPGSSRVAPSTDTSIMKKSVQFLFDFGSPNAYLCHKVLPAFALRTGARVVAHDARCSSSAIVGMLFSLRGGDVRGDVGSGA